ncbi:MAG TPA: AAA family ATPase [Puia sp.]|nr:AAA family ATPase [Puia sp.]
MAVTTKKRSKIKPKVSIINQLEIKNFKSIKHIKIDTSRINIFLGKPNSGKSNLLEALTLFNFIQNKTSRQNEATLIRYNTLDNLFYDRDLSNDIEVNFNQNLALLSYYAATNFFLQIVNPSSDFLKNKPSYYKDGLSLNQIQEKSPLTSKQARPDKYSSLFAAMDQEGQSTTQATGALTWENPIRKYEFRDGISYNNPFATYLESSGENLFTIVQDNPKIREWINSFFEEFHLEFLIDFSSRKFEIQKKEKGIVYKIPFELTPDTLRRMLFYVAAIYSNKNATILLEEPESHSFPPYIKELSELIKADTNNTYFITTHSPYFFNSMVEDSKTIKGMSFFHVYYEDYQTKIRKLTQKDLDILWGSGVDAFFNIESLNK